MKGLFLTLKIKSIDTARCTEIIGNSIPLHLCNEPPSLYSFSAIISHIIMAERWDADHPHHSPTQRHIGYNKVVHTAGLNINYMNLAYVMICGTLRQMVLSFSNVLKDLILEFVHIILLYYILVRCLLFLVK